MIAAVLMAIGEGWAFVLWSAPVEPWQFVLVLAAGPAFVGVVTYALDSRMDSGALGALADRVESLEERLTVYGRGTLIRLGVGLKKGRGFVTPPDAPTDPPRDEPPGTPSGGRP